MSSKLVPKIRFKEFSGDWEENKTDIKILSGNNYPLESYSKKGILLIQGLNIYPNKLSLDKPIYISNEYLTNKDIFIQNNDILIGLNRPIIDNKLKLCLFNKDKAILYQRAGVLKFNTENLYSKFFYFYLSSKQFLNQISSELIGSDQPYIKADLFKKIKIFIPPTPKEQQKIANTFNSLDNLIVAYNKKLEALKEHKKGLMQKMFVSEGLEDE